MSVCLSICMSVQKFCPKILNKALQLLLKLCLLFILDTQFNSKNTFHFSKREREGVGEVSIKKIISQNSCYIWQLKTENLSTNLRELCQPFTKFNWTFKWKKMAPNNFFNGRRPQISLEMKDDLNYFGNWKTTSNFFVKWRWPQIFL